ncbi:MNIO family bufferin maturase [Amorphus sp. MBR-141]
MSPSAPTTRVASPVPARAGVGLKLQHVHDILEGADIGFFEVHAENQMGDGGPPHRLLAAIRERFPLSVHGVGLSIGGAGPLDRDHLARLKAVVERTDPGLVSEHLAWSTHDGVYVPDLLPLPYTEATLATVADHVDQVQDALGRPILIENPSTYLAFAETTLTETEFLAALARRTGCGLLLDVNNVAVACANRQSDPDAYLAAFPMAFVGEIHLGGHAPDHDTAGRPLLIDTHDRPICRDVWDLFARTLALAGRPIPTLIEWDDDVPAWPELAAEAARAEAILVRAHPDAEARRAV